MDDQPSADATPPPNSVGALALAMHRARELQARLPEELQAQAAALEGASVKAGQLCFASLAHRNQAVVAYVLQELADQRTDANALWNAAHELWRREIGCDDMASGRLLAVMHPQMDVLRLAGSRITNGRDVFDALHLVQAALPYLDALDSQSLLALCDIEQPLTKGDMAGGLIYSAIERWLTTHPPTGRELVELLLRQLGDERGNLLGAAWMAWFASEPAQAVAELLRVHDSGDPLLRRITCWTAGRMLAQPSLDPVHAAGLDRLILAHVGAADAGERTPGLAAATALLHLRNAYDAALRARISAGDLEAAAFVANALPLHDEKLLESGSFFKWLAVCVGLGEGYEGVLRHLDYTLSTMLRPDSPHAEAVLAFLESWIKAHPQTKARNREFTETFDSCTHQIAGHADLLQRVVTRWLLSDGQELPSAAAAIVGALGVRGKTNLAFDAAHLDTVADADLRFLARRMLGFLLEADHMVSLALSLLRLRDAHSRVHPLLWWLLYDEIGYDYRHTTTERLRAHVANEQDGDAKAILTAIADRLAADVAEFEALPRLRELSVPRAVRRAFQKARGKQMQSAQREAQKKSVLLQLVSQVHVKAGESTFSYAHGQFSEPTGFGSYSLSIELPRREVLDPVGNAWRRHRLRYATRGET